MSRKSSSNKFVIIDESDEGVYNHLYKLVIKLSLDNGNPNNIMVDADEIFGELLEEIAKGLKVYKHLCTEQKVVVIRRMLDFRISELKYKYYITYRKEHSMDYSVESDESVETNPSKAMSPEERSEAHDQLATLKSLLSEKALKVLDCMLSGGNARLNEILLLNSLKPYGNDKIKPWMMSEAMLISEADAKEAFSEIRAAYRKVYVHVD